MSSLSIFKAALAILAALPLSTNAATCPPLGPVLPVPQAPTNSKRFKHSVSLLTKELCFSIEGKVKGSAISIAAKSIHEDGPFLNYHFTPPSLSGLGTSKVDENTIYRVGSISKLMPPLLVLLQKDGGVSMDDPVTKYIPELAVTTAASDVTSPKWDETTVGALASHLAGLAGDSATDLAVFPLGQWTDKGLPAIPQKSPPTCSGYPGTRPCTAADLILDMQHRTPIYLPDTTPIYSNIGLALLGLVLSSESATNQSFHSLVQSTIFTPLSMTSSSFDGFPPTFPQRGFIPPGETTWNSTLGVYEPAGGMFTSTTDLLKLGTAILSSTLLPSHKTRQWLRPISGTTSLDYMIGAPWEILRSDAVTTDGHTVDVYTKTGDLGLYHAVVALVPDYDVVVTVMVGGEEVTALQSRKGLLSKVLGGLIPALEKAGREEVVKAGYVGRFVDGKSNSSLVLGVDDGPGLVIESFVVRGFDVLNNFAGGAYGLSAAYGAETKVGVKGSGRLYPTNRMDEGGKGVKKGVEERAWRGVIDRVEEEGGNEQEVGEFYEGGKCGWAGGGVSYNFLDLLDFVFVKGSGKNGAVKEIRNAAFEVTLRRG